MDKRRFTSMMLLLGTMATVAYSICPNPQLCECTRNYINCTCLQNEELDFVATGQKLVVKELIVNGCGKVRLKEYSLEHADVISVHLFNLLELCVESLAFQNAKIKDLLIYNISTFTVEEKAFARISDMVSFTIRNAALERLTSGVFSETIIPSVIIKDSRIKTTEPGSFQLKRSKNITIENNTIDTIETSSFRIDTIEDFIFVYNAVRSTAAFSYTFDTARNVGFRYCRFEEIMSNMILAKGVQNFELNRNYIRTCEENAFSGMRGCKNISFVGNQVLIAKNNSLIPNENITEVQTIASQDNEIGCDCGIEWLIATDDPKYNDFKERNVCHYPLGLRRSKLSELGVKRSKENGCDGLSHFTFTGTDIPTTTSASVSAAHRREGNIFIGDSTVTSTVGEASSPIKPSSEKLLKDDQVECKDGEFSDGNSAKVYQISVIVLLLALITSID